MSEQRKANLAVIGVGSMGSLHLQDINALENARLCAVCDTDLERAGRWAQQYQVAAYSDYRELLERPDLDGVLIATPHYAHTPLAIAFLEKGLHTLVEKPLAVHAQDGRKMVSAFERSRAQRPGLVFAIMFQQRTYGYWRKVKELIEGGELGRLVRATWIITDWYRPQCYYDSGGWRATWKGEGGGVLLNQCPHNLDLYQWFFGLPARVGGFAALGKYHAIEVEDEVTAFFEHAGGMVGHLISSTAESPGTNRLEIVGEQGKLVCEDGKLVFDRNRVSMLDFIRTSRSAFDKVESVREELPFPAHSGLGHKTVIQNFAAAILSGEKLIAPAVEGLNSLLLSNAILLSAWAGRPVELPFDEADYADRLAGLAGNSR